MHAELFPLVVSDPHPLDIDGIEAENKTAEMGLTLLT
jgi:hypothetical protein